MRFQESSENLGGLLLPRLSVRRRGSEYGVVLFRIFGQHPSLRLLDSRKPDALHASLRHQFIQERLHWAFKLIHRDVAQTPEPFRHLSFTARRLPYAPQTPIDVLDSPRIECQILT